MSEGIPKEYIGVSGIGHKESGNGSKLNQGC